MVTSIAHWKQQVKSGLFSPGIVADILSAQRIEEYCRAAGHRWRCSFWSPTLTVFAFLLQVLDGAKTLRSAVAILLTQLSLQGSGDLPSADPTAFCQARQRIPLPALQQLLGWVADQMTHLVQAPHRWLGHRVWVADGSNVSMPDTPELQQAFPQHCQREGCGFPIAQFSVLFCWSTGAIVDLALDTLGFHEVTLFRRLWFHFRAGDVVLGDRAYGSYVDLVRLQLLGVFAVFRLHQRREADFRRGQRLGKDDVLQTWNKPEQWLPSRGLSEKEFASLPAQLTVRLVRIAATPPGFRSRSIVLVTTLLDPVLYPADAIRDLYRDRWTAELNFRSLKTQLGMEVLRGQSPDVVRKEIIMHLLGYNLIRLLMWEAARKHGRDLHRLSFTGTLHRLRQSLPLLLLRAQSGTVNETHHFEQLLEWIADDLVPDRPDRIEPRRVKRRPKTYSRLTHPRAFYNQRTVGVDRDAR